MANRNEPKSPHDLQPIDYVMSALENALHSGMTLAEVVEVGTFAASIKSLDNAISLYSHMLPSADEYLGKRRGCTGLYE